MSSPHVDTAIAEYGDFQTPMPLAQQVCQLLSKLGLIPFSLIEPTCGTGNMLLAALDQFPTICRAVALDISPEYVVKTRQALVGRGDAGKVQVLEGSFFSADWASTLRELPDPMLVIGNPPWVTNTDLGKMGSSNLPKKRNLHGYAGFDALTGKSNFDISESMLIQMLHWLHGREAMLAMLCKTSVARKVLNYGWRNRLRFSDCAIYAIDAVDHFSAAVDACLLMCRFSHDGTKYDCAVYPSIGHSQSEHIIGYRDGMLIADIRAYERSRHLYGNSSFRWRSGIKHDCARVMELRKDGNCYWNGFGERVDIENMYLYPMLKSSDLANGTVRTPRRWMLVIQRSMGQDTSVISQTAPKTWDYLQQHAHALDARGSSIYRNRPRFSIFGVGDYSFAPWKVAISGFYKAMNFSLVGSFEGKPIVLDDTLYFIPCQTQEQATQLCDVLNSDEARRFFEAFVFWDAKRPLTIDLLSRLDIDALQPGMRGCTRATTTPLNLGW